MVDEKFDMTQQCELAAHKANRILGYSQSSSLWTREGILPLCAALVGLHHPALGPRYGKDTGLLKQVQRRDGKIIEGIPSNKSCSMIQ